MQLVRHEAELAYSLASDLHLSYIKVLVAMSLPSQFDGNKSDT